MTHDRINLGRRKQEGTPECQINLRNRKAIVVHFETGPSIAFPPDHMVDVDGEQPEEVR